jgi:transcriptional accessory protein Tex/SPT6
MPTIITKIAQELRVQEQSAGFLRIRYGDNPLDMTGVHPETYSVVQEIIVKTGKTMAELMGCPKIMQGLRPELFAHDKFGISHRLPCLWRFPNSHRVGNNASV